MGGWDGTRLARAVKVDPDLYQGLDGGTEVSFIGCVDAMASNEFNDARMGYDYMWTFYIGLDRHKYSELLVSQV
ncbi:hypothetical protein DYGSA30_00640 [Dyella sp. GSA-30]|nr:hypothetical protein DYGSA30_00640 [Dyella sp. GSA-30]